MRELEPFSNRMDCPKCRGVMWTFRYVFAKEGDPEYLRVTCQGCGYMFPMKTADAA